MRTLTDSPPSVNVKLTRVPFLYKVIFLMPVVLSVAFTPIINVFPVLFPSAAAGFLKERLFDSPAWIIGLDKSTLNVRLDVKFII